MKQHLTLLFSLFLLALFVFLTSCTCGTVVPNLPQQEKECKDFTQTSDGILVTCNDGSTYTLKNGQDGKQGETGPQGEQGVAGKDGTNSIQEIINPCGVNTGNFDEIIFRLNNNQYLCYFEIGNNSFLTLLTPGKYTTTDTQHCAFQITEDYEYVED